MVAQPMTNSYDQPPPKIICDQCRQAVHRVSRFHLGDGWLCSDCILRGIYRREESNNPDA